MKKQDAELRQQEMLEKPVERLIVRMGLPTMASMLLSSLYNLVDTYFVSQINTSASAAAGVAFPLLVLIQAVSLALAIGGGSYAARYTDHSAICFRLCVLGHYGNAILQRYLCADDCATAGGQP